MFSGIFANRSKYPGWVREYLSLDFKTEVQQSIWAPAYIVLDCETTGIARKDQIVTIGAVEVKGKSISLGHLLDIHLPLSENSVAATIHEELADQSGPFEIIEALQEVLAFLQNRPIVGHHISFDIRKLNQLFQEYFPGFKLKNQVLDTMILTRRLDPVRYERNVAGNESMQLDVLCEEFGIIIENRHTALGDAFLTAQLFQRLLPKLEQRGIKTLSALVRSPGLFSG